MSKHSISQMVRLEVASIWVEFKLGSDIVSWLAYLFTYLETARLGGTGL